MTDLLATSTDTDNTDNGAGIAPTAEAADLLDGLTQLYEDTDNENTRRTYEAGWKQFEAFANRLGFDALPAPPEGIVLWIQHLAEEGHAPSTIETRLTAVTVRHKNEGHEPPTGDPRVKDVKRRHRKASDHRTSKRKPILLKHLQKMRFDGGNEIKEIRDRALLYIGFAGGFRRSELVGFRIDDVTFAEDGAVLHLRKSKTDQDGTGRHVPIPEDVPALDVTPLDALREWLDAAGIESGPIFRGVDRWGNVREGALSGQAVYNVVKARVESIGEDPSAYGAHSLRAGYATQGYLDGIGEHELAQQTGHKKLETLRGYQRVNVVMENHPLSRMTAETTP